MKKNIFILCIAFAMALVSCNKNNEPEMSPVQDGKVSFTIPARTINAGGGAQSAARKINGNLTEKYIVFKWEVEDKIEFKFYDSNKNLIKEELYTVQASDMSSDKTSISVLVDAPNNAQYATAATGPETIKTEQLHVVNAMSSNHMRFETDDLIPLNPGENTLPMNPIWSAIIITPTYEYYFDDIDDNDRSYVSTTIGLDKITLTQTIGTEVLEVNYIYRNKGGNQTKISKTAYNGATPSTPYIIVVNPAEECDLAIDLYYKKDYFSGESDKQWEDEGMDPFKLKVDESQTTIQTISMHTEEQSVKGIEKGQAYDVPVMKHPLVIHWITVDE
ncbi:MAG: hypothetical protein MJZ64_05650 [Paludibacteraceae bacterium]|nr:hypothetical protein [Paludibacteraceae bacterium]